MACTPKSRERTKALLLLLLRCVAPTKVGFEDVLQAPRRGHVDHQRLRLGNNLRIGADESCRSGHATELCQIHAQLELSLVACYVAGVWRARPRGVPGLIRNTPGNC